MSAPTSPTTAVPLSIEEQHKYLEEAMAAVRVQGKNMNIALEAKQIMEAVKFCSEMLSELCTSALGPKMYYELYLSVFDQLRGLYSQLKELKSDPIIPDLYELVQYAGSIMPRLYMMITVGVLYIDIKEANRLDILKDMLDMCRGVQHPTRGLFLRHYLCNLVKDCLPDVSGLREGESVLDSVSFILQNFTEMNKLWVRMQYQGPSKERDRRELERKELKILVGTNLVRLSQLDGVDATIYSQNVLPRIVEQIVGCRDPIAQEYLMEVIIQVFPDEYHLRTLEMFLEATGDLTPDVSVKNIVISLMDRLSNYARMNENDKAILQDVQLFDIFWHQTNRIATSRQDIPLIDFISLSIALLNLAITCYPNETSYFDRVLKFASSCLERHGTKDVDHSNPNCGKLVVKLLKIPLEVFQNVLKLLPFENFGIILQFLSLKARKVVARNILENMIENRTFVGEVGMLEKLLTLVSPLIANDERESCFSTNRSESVNPGASRRTIVIELDDFVDEQYVVAKTIHLLRGESPEQQFELISYAYKNFKNGGCLRMRYTIPPLVHQLSELVRWKTNTSGPSEADSSKMLKLMYNMINGLLTCSQDELMQVLSQSSSEFTWLSSFAANHLHELGLKLYLQALDAADYCNCEDMAYEFAVQTLTLYEEQISDTKTQNFVLPLIVRGIHQTTVFCTDKYDTLASKCVVYSNKLLKKPDQCRAICNASHLFWQTQYDCFKDGRKVLECLQKALKIADTCMDAVMNIQLFVEILNRYIYFYKYGNRLITLQSLDSLVDLIQSNLNNMESHDVNESVSAYFARTFEFYQKTRNDPIISADFERRLVLKEEDSSTSSPVSVPLPVPAAAELNMSITPPSQPDVTPSITSGQYPSSAGFEIGEEQPW